MKPESARALWIFAMIFAMAGSTVPSPSGRFFLSVVATLVALPPAIFGPGRTRLGGAIVCILSLALVVTSFPAMRKDQVAYSELSKRKNAVTSAPAPECGEHVPPAKLIANPDVYHGKVLWVVAYATVDFENMTACPSENETQIKSCLWLGIDDGPHKTDRNYARYQSKSQIWKRFNHQTVAIHATFDKDEKGHFSMWPGGLGKVTEVSGNQDGWSFIANATVPSNCMTGK